jgi:hypothetical protein
LYWSRIRNKIGELLLDYFGFLALVFVDNGSDKDILRDFVLFAEVEVALHQVGDVTEHSGECKTAWIDLFEVLELL